MATVTALVDRVCDVTGLQKDAGSDERKAVLSFVDQAYSEICLDAEAGIVPFTFATTSGVGDYAVGVAPFPLNISAIDYLQASTAAGEFDLEPRSVQEIMTWRLGSLAATGPVAYAFAYPNLYLHPVPDSSTTISGTGLATPLTLVETNPTAGVSEKTPSYFPAAWHYRTIGNKSIYYAYEFDNQEDKGTKYLSLADREVRRLANFLHKRAGGIELPPWTRRVGMPLVSPSQDLGY